MGLFGPLREAAGREPDSAPGDCGVPGGLEAAGDVILGGTAAVDDATAAELPGCSGRVAGGERNGDVCDHRARPVGGPEVSSFLFDSVTSPVMAFGDTDLVSDEQVADADGLGQPPA